MNEYRSVNSVAVCTPQPIQHQFSSSTVVLMFWSAAEASCPSCSTNASSILFFIYGSFVPQDYLPRSCIKTFFWFDAFVGPRVSQNSFALVRINVLSGRTMVTREWHFSSVHFVPNSPCMNMTWKKPVHTLGCWNRATQTLA